MDGNAAESMAVVLAAIVGVSLALTQAVGPLLVYLTEAIKATGKVKDGYAGIVTLVLGMLVGGSLGGLTDAMASGESYGMATMIVLGVFGGALMAAGAVKTYKAMGEVNAKSATVTIDSSALSNQSFDDEPETMQEMRSRLAAFGQPTDLPLTQADIDAMRAELDALDDYVQDPDTPNVVPAPPLEPEVTEVAAAPSQRVTYADPEARK